MSKEERTYWKKRNKRTNKISGFLDEAIGISSVLKPKQKKPQSKPVILIIDRDNIKQKRKNPKKKKPPLSAWI